MKIFNTLFNFLIVVFFLSTALVSQAQQSAPCFVAQSSGLYSNIDASPVGVTVADFNGDGTPDAATINNSSSDINILFGTGSADALDYPSGMTPNISLSGLTPVAITSGNFNGDQYMDIAVAGYIPPASYGLSYTYYVYIYYINTNGPIVAETLSVSTTEITIPTSGNSSLSGNMSVADFDADGLKDIVVTDNTDQEVFLLLSKQSYNVSNPIVSGIDAYGVACGDFNADGAQDFVVGTNTDGNEDFVYYYGNLSGGQITFPNTGIFNTNSGYSSYITSMTTGDFNNDGTTDAAGEGNGEVFVLLGSKSSGLSSPSIYYTSGGTSGITSGNFNGDSYTDIAVSYYSNSAGLLISDGATGTFNNYQTSFIATTDGSGASLTGIAAGDFNKDNETDLVVIDGPLNTLSLTLNGYVNFTPSISGLSQQYCSTDANLYPLTGNPSGGTFSGDGVAVETLTVFIPEQAWEYGDQASVVSYAYNYTNGCTYYAYDTTYIIAPTASANPNFSLAATYFADQEQDTILMYPPGGTFSGPGISANTFSVAGYSGYTGAIFTPKVGTDTIVYTYNNASLGCSSTVTMTTQVYGSAEVSTNAQTNTQPLCLSLPSNYNNPNNDGEGAAYNVASIVTGDFNGDGKIDVVAAESYDGTIDVYTNYLQGGFSTNVSSFSSGADISYVVSGYFNNDKLLDLVTLGYNGETEGDEVDIFINQSTASAMSFNNVNSYYTGFSAQGIVSADFNNDTYADIAVLENNNGPYGTPPSISILTNNSGNGFVDTNTIYLAPSGPLLRVEATLPVKTQSPSSYTISYVTGITTGDFNNDKYIDFAVSGYTNGTIMPIAVIVLNNQQNGFYVDTTIAIVVSANVYGNAITSGDFNKDGLTDIAMAAAKGCPNCREETISVSKNLSPMPSANSYIYVLNNNKSFSFSVNGFSSVATQPNTIITVDLNRDGIPDLLSANGDGNNDGTYEVYAGDGKGNFADASPPNNLLGSDMVGLATGDFNGDGKPDFVISDDYYTNTSTEITVLLNGFERVSIPSLDTTYCSSALSVKLYGSPSGGSFASTSSAITTTGTDTARFNPAAVTPGAYADVSYTYTNIAGCIFTYNDSAKVYAPDTLTITGLQKQYCINTLAVATLKGSPAGGTFSDPVVSGAIVAQPGGVTGFSVANAGLGVHDVIYTYKNPVTGCTTKDTAITDVFSPSSVFFAGLNPYYCTNAANVTLTGFPSGGTFSGPGVTGNVFSPSVLTAGKYAIIYTYTDAANCSGADTLYTTIYKATPVSFSGLAPTYCANNSSVTLQPTPTGGTFTSPGSPSGTIVNNVFNPAAAGAGTYEVVYNYTDSKTTCAYADTLTTTVYSLTPVTFTGLEPLYCANPTFDTLISSPTGGAFSGTGITQDSLFSPAQAGAGSQSVTYTYIDGNQCTNTFTLSTTVYALPKVSYSGLNSYYCILTSALAILNGQPAGGNFTGDPNIQLPNVFDPSTAGVGTHTIIYTYTDAHNCTNSYTDSTQIYLLPPISVTGFDTAFCLNTPATKIVGLHPPLAGTASYAGLGITQGTDTTFNASVAGVGSQTIIYSYTDSSGCSNSDTLKTYVHGLTPVSFTGLAASYCANASPVTLSGTPIGGTFSGVGNALSGTTFSPIGTGLTAGGIYAIVYAYTDTNHCTNTDTVTTNIVALPKLNIQGADTFYCSKDPVANISGNPSGGTLTVFGGTYTASSSDAGTFQPTLQVPTDSSENGSMIYSYTDIATGCSNVDTLNITIYRIPVISFTSASACFGGNAVPLLASAVPAGGQFTYSNPSGLSNVIISGNMFNPAAVSTTGVYDVPVTYATAGGCTVTSTDKVSVDKPTLQVSSSANNGNYCNNGAADTIVVTSPNSSGTGSFIFSNQTAFISIANGIAVFNPSSANSSENYTYYYSDTLGCKDTLTNALTVNASPAQPVVSDSLVVCSTHSLTISATESTSGVTYQWTKAGNAVSTSQNVIISSADTSNSGLYTVTAMKAYGSLTCSSDASSVYVLVQQSPVISNLYVPYTSVCDFNTSSVIIEVQPDSISYGYDWYYNDIRISGQHGSILNISTVGTYKVGVSHLENGCITYDSATINGNSQKPTISVLGSPLDSVLESSHANSYQWYVNNKRIIGETDSVIDVGYNGTYSVLASYSGGCKEFSETYTVNRYDFININRLSSQTDSTITIPSTSSPASSNIIFKYDDVSKNYYVEYTPVQDEVITITLTAMTGEVLWKKDVRVEKWQLSSTPVNVSNLASAMYILNAATQDQSKYKKIIVD